MKERRQFWQRTQDDEPDHDRADLPAHGHWAPLVVGEPIFEFEPRPPDVSSYRPDTVYDDWSCDNFAVRMACVRGYAHRYRGIPRQDEAEVAFHPQSGAVMFAVADGVSSARQAHIGATIACRSAMYALRHQMNAARDAVNWAKVLDDTARSLTSRAADTLRQDAPAQEAVLDLFATTLVAGYVAPARGGPVASMVQVGDTSAWILRHGRYRSVLTDKHDQRQQVVSSAVTPLPVLPDRVMPVTIGLPSDAVLLVGTDGFGDALGDGDGQVGRLFATCLRTPPPGRAFAHLLDFSRETFDDDRTLVGVWPRETGQEMPR
ncbi:MAG TPA: protein phosphatase 2C domain-containing protein [Streptosporangiaceae bacterium]|nr:protein phosphatase 2C domain-containing protein [Streptosporangiaceae bacterium]